MKRKAILFLLVFILFGLAAVTPVQAFEMREGTDITVSKDTVVKGTLAAGGSTITIDGTVDGDLYCAAQTVVIRGTVTGDVLCAAQSITISGTVGESVRVVSQLLDITGNIKRNVAAMGQTVNVHPGAAVAGELMAAGQTVNLNSTIGGDVNIAVESITLGEKARLAGNFTYTSTNVVSEATGAAITGKISHIVPKKEESGPVKNLAPKSKPWGARAAESVIFYLIVGAIAVLFSKEKMTRIKEQMLARPWFDGLVGFLTMIGAPIAIMMVAITIIGIPIALILGVIFAVMIFLSRVYVAVIVGDKLLSSLGRTKPGLYLQVIIGVIVIELLAVVPILGWFVGCVATLWGLGGIVMNLGKQKATK